ncbi:MAG: hypothetical protein E7183_07755 [Erysipelotrichaceae bacterium]|nr:hypothetical protein [Erysipelotrichaceae bacterium]
MVIFSEIVFWLIVLLVVILTFKIVRLNALFKSYNYMPYYCMSLGYCGLIFGKKGSNKSTLLNFISQMITKGLVMEQNSRMHEIKESLKDINFNEVNKYIDDLVNAEMINNEFIDTVQLDRSKIKNSFYNYLAHFQNELNTYHTDYLSIKSKIDLLYDYMEYYFNINYPGDYMLHNGYRYNITHRKLAKWFDVKSMELNTAVRDNNWQICYPVVVTYDEASHHKGNIKSNSKEQKESGSSITLSLARNGGDDLIYYWAAVQENGNYFKEERDQMDVLLRYHDKRMIRVFPSVQNACSLIKKIAINFNQLKYRIKYLFRYDKYLEEWDKYYNSPGILRNLIVKLNKINNFLFSYSIMKLRFKGYYRIEDTKLKDDTGLYDRYQFVGPLYAFWGTFDSHSYKALFRELDSNYTSNSSKYYSSKCNTEDLSNQYITFAERR